MKRVVLLTGLFLVLVGCGRGTALELEERIAALEKENMELQQRTGITNPELFNDGAVKVKCQELRESAEYQDRETVDSDGMRTYDVFYSPVLNTCVVETSIIKSSGVYNALFDGLGEVGFRTIIEYESYCEGIEGYDITCTAAEEYQEERQRILPEQL